MSSNRGGKLVNKVKIFFQARKILENWQELPSIYYKIGNEKFVTLKLRNGLRIKIRKNSTDLMQFATIWLLKEYTKSGFEINDEDVIIDIGSHIGMFAIYASQFCKKGKIFCFEPVKENYDLLIENLKLNKISNVVPFNEAVSKTDGTVSMFLKDDASGHNLYETTEDEIKVSSISLKTFFEESKQENYNLIKIDCEGAEYDIIESLPENYFKKIDKTMIEYHFADKKSDDFESMLKKLKSCSFTINQEKNTDSMGMIYAKR